MLETIGQFFGKKTEFSNEKFIAIDRDTILSSEGPQKYEVLASLAACQCIRDDLLGVRNDGNFAKNAIVLSKQKLENQLSPNRRKAILRTLNSFSAIREDIAHYTSDIPLTIAVELELRKTSAEKNSAVYKKAGEEAA